MGSVARYLNRLLLARFLVILLAVAGFAMLLDLLDVGSRVLQRGDGTTVSLAHYAIVRLPSLISDLIPIVALLASLAMTFDLFRHRELFILWSAGLSRQGLMLRLLPTALLLCGLKLALDDVAIPRAAPLLHEIGISDLAGVGDGQSWRWLRSAEDVIRIPAGGQNGDRLENVTIFERNEKGQLIARLTAARAELQPEGWRLEQVVRRPASSQTAEHLPELFWPVAIDATKLEVMAKLPRELTIGELVAVLLADGYGLGSTEGHRTWLHARLAGAVTVVLMSMLGQALVRGSTRRSIALPLFGYGMAIGFLAMLCNGVLLALGEVGLVAPELAAWLVPTMLILIILGATFPLTSRSRVRRRDPSGFAPRAIAR